MPEKQKSGWKPGCKREESRKVILEKIEFCPDGGEKLNFTYWNRQDWEAVITSW